MRFATTEAVGVLEAGGFEHYWAADVIYDGERRLQDVRIGDVRLNDDDGSAIKGKGSCTITWTDAFGESILPSQIGDVFSPFGTELAIYSIVRSGGVTERIPYGVFQVTDVPEMRDQSAFFRGMTVTAGSVLHLELMDRLWTVGNDRFDVPSTPSQLESVYRELATVTGLQITKGVDDGPIARSVPYEEDRLEAVMKLAEVIAGTPYMTADGTLSVRPRAWTTPVATLDGSLVDVRRGMSSKGVYNRVTFRSTSTSQTPIVATAEVTSGPLRTANPGGGRSPAHRRTTFRSNDLVATAEQAQAYVDSELVKVAQLSAVQWPIVMTFDPRFESGDVVTIVDEGTPVLARFLSITRGDSGSGTQSAVVIRG